MYIAARSTSRCQGAIDKIKAETTRVGSKAKGRLESMAIDLADLSTVKPAVEQFLKQESRLDVLVHNAAVMTPPAGSKDKLVRDTFVLCWSWCGVRGETLLTGTLRTGS